MAKDKESQIRASTGDIYRLNISSGTQFNEDNSFMARRIKRRVARAFSDHGNMSNMNVSHVGAAVPSPIINITTCNNHGY